MANTSTVIGLTSSGRIYKRHFAHAICGDDIVITLRYVQRHVPGSFVIIWERLNAYRTKVVKASVEAHPEIEWHWLPPYAPERNPEEGCHGHGKQHLHNALPTNVANLRRDRTDERKE